MSREKEEFLERSKKYWNPGKTEDWQRMEIDLVIDRRHGYYLYDMDGRRLIDVHLNGGTYNIGHRNPEVIAAVQEGMKHFDIGNHHFPSLMRTELAEKLYECTPDGLQYSIYGSGGAEAIDIALKSARHATQRRKIISIQRCYHGHTGIAVACGDPRFSKLFLSDGPEDVFVQVPFNDMDAMKQAISVGDAACVIMETVPATYGFPMPKEGYLAAIKEMCERYGTLYVADEVQTGLMRTGHMWGIEHYGVTPDILVTGKGLSGGVYPIAAVVASERAAAWLHEDGFGHMSSFGGSELGCIAAMKTLEICQRPEVKTIARYIADRVRAGLDSIQRNYSEFFIGIRQLGVVMGLEFNHPEGAKYVMKWLYQNGVWAIFSTLDPQVLQFKPGILWDRDLCDDVLDRVDIAVGQAQAEVFGTRSMTSSCASAGLPRSRAA
ncbi:MAG: aminotransferase class III-fold pyridoxal phosphate-dependent enzyme [Gammaproteobacteria bacterium]|nr:aminotransferase class III-fold pyridoxal phosphate-dependent enzyme [Gammaproteobacteria bacterium]